MLALPMPDKRYPPIPPPRARMDSRREVEEDSEPPGEGIQRFEDMNPRQLALATAYLVQETKLETARVAAIQEQHTDQIGALTTEQQRMARTQQRHKERLDTLESRPPLSVPPHAGDLSQSGRHILTPVDAAMEQQIEFQALKKKAAFVDWMTRGSGTVFVSLVTAGVIFLVVWLTRALTLANTLGKRP
jgi:hypothetical protein